MSEQRVMVITGTRKGIGRYLAEYYLKKGFRVIACSRKPVDYRFKNYRHFCLNVCNETKVKQMFTEIRKTYNRLDVLINNAGIASMNYVLLTPFKTAQDILNTNFMGTFLFCREAAKLMQKNHFGRIINFTTIAAPLKLEGEAIYASSKAAVSTFTQILAKEVAEFGITVNAVGPSVVKTDLVRSVPVRKITNLIQQQSIHRFAKFSDISNVIDFFIQPESDFITGQAIFLGGV